MTINENFDISETEEHGVILKISGSELADEFDDFLNENYYVFFDTKFESDSVCLYFGQTAHLEKVKRLINQFIND